MAEAWVATFKDRARRRTPLLLVRVRRIGGPRLDRVLQRRETPRSTRRHPPSEYEGEHTDSISRQTTRQCWPPTNDLPTDPGWISSRRNPSLVFPAQTAN